MMDSGDLGSFEEEEEDNSWPTGAGKGVTYKGEGRKEAPCMQLLLKMALSESKNKKK